MFLKHGRNDRWHKLKKLTDRLIREQKEKFYNRQKSQATNSRNPSQYYKAVCKLKDREKTPNFDICELFPKESPYEVAEPVVTFFSAITENMEPLEERKDQQCESDFVMFERYQIAAKLRSFKKPKSMVEGDIYTELCTTFADVLAIPLTKIYNQCLQEGVWPKKWKEETTIPKVTIPSSLDEIRNLSCTCLFSKVLESIVLSRLQEECSVGINQFGGIKGSGTEMYLVKTWETILEALDDGKSAVNLLSIDF